MDQFVEGKNPYTILGLEQGEKSTLDEIKKVKHSVDVQAHDGCGCSEGSARAAAVALLLLPSSGLSAVSTGEAS
jgi:hypothetical protein